MGELKPWGEIVKEEAKRQGIKMVDIAKSMDLTRGRLPAIMKLENGNVSNLKKAAKAVNAKVVIITNEGKKCQIK